MSTNYPQYPLSGTSPQQPQQQTQAFDVMVDHWSASMLLAVQAIQHLHAAFDGKFIRSKSNP
jgi:hypothetical protein